MAGPNNLREIKHFEKIFERLAKRTLKELNKEYKDVKKTNFSQKETIEEEILYVEKMRW